MSKPENQGDRHLVLTEVLAAEYHALRPASGYGEAAADIASLRRRAHEESNPLSALCISGGGIRSATFALGALQGLANRGVLEQFDYVSTVSGGGYIGSWLTAWCKRTPGGLKDVIPYLRSDAKPAEPRRRRNHLPESAINGDFVGP